MNRPKYLNFWGALAFNLYFITIVVSQNWLIQIYKNSFLIIIRPVLRSFYLCCTLSQLANLWFLSNESPKLNVTGLTPVDFLAIAYFITSFLSTSTANTGTLYLRIKICHREFGPADKFHWGIRSARPDSLSLYYGNYGPATGKLVRAAIARNVGYV